jgi:hypothetical protein
LLSGAVAEGIDLKGVRHVHIMEPFWNYARINQVQTRAIRFKSHDDLPEDQQNVQTYIYLSDYPSNMKRIAKAKKHDEDADPFTFEDTTDIELYRKSIDNMQIINDFLLVIAESSIDCALHYPSLSDKVKEQISCKLCSPDNKPLFHPVLSKDMELPSNCMPYSEKKVTVQEVVIPDTNEKFYFRKTNGNVSLYMYNKKLKGYSPVPRSHPYYGKLMSKILTP